MARQDKLKVNLVSFGFKHGAPEQVNFIWDVRFLPNPHWVEELRPKTGLDNDVSDYVVASAEGHNFIKLMKPVILFLVQQNITAEKDEITLAVGCTGGKHRSVAVAEVFCDMMRVMPVDLQIRHRDIDRDE